MMLQNPDGRGERGGKDEPEGGGLGFHAFCRREILEKWRTSNIEHSTFNLHRTRVPALIGCRVLNVEC
jgi:hypothetical protein